MLFHFVSMAPESFVWIVMKYGITSLLKRELITSDVCQVYISLKHVSVTNFRSK